MRRTADMTALVACAALAPVASLLATLLGVSCRPTGDADEEGTLPRPVRVAGRAPDADLLALVPDGAHLVATVDLEGLRRMARGRPWAKRAAEAGAPLAGRLPGDLGGELLARAKVLVLALWMEEGGAGQALLLARGEPAPPPDEAPGVAREGSSTGARGGSPGVARGVSPTGARGVSPTGARQGPPTGARGGSRAGAPHARKARESLAALVRARLQGRGKPVEWERYRGMDLATFGQEATALVTSRTVVSGSLPLVKHALDLFREVPGFSSAREDRELMALWQLVAGPGEGRAPALGLVSRFPSGMRGRLSARLGLGSPPLRGGLRMSAAEWVTVRAFVDCPDKASAQAVIEAAKKAVGRAAGTALARELRLAPLFGRLAVHQEGARVHAQWLAPLALLDPYLTRIIGLLVLRLPADRPQAFPKPEDPLTK